MIAKLCTSASSEMGADASEERSTMRRLAALAVVAAITSLGLLAIGGPAQATFPAQNGRIAFAGDTGSGAEIYTMNADGTGLRRLTHLHGFASTPDWSPDGTRIVFSLLEAPDKGLLGIYIMSADGSDLHQVTTSEVIPYGGGPAAFTRDGQHLVYECPGWDTDKCGGHSAIFLMRDDGSDIPGLGLSSNPFHAEGDANPEVSPDGQTVTFVRHKVDGKLQALYAVNIDGSADRKLTSYRLEVAIKHDWAPDGKHILLTTKADYPEHKSPNLATIRPDGSHLRMLTHYTGGEKGAFAGSYSPNGRWIVFRVENLERESFRLFKMHPDGTHRKLIKSLPFSPRGSDWGPRP
jgi:dipeptidyl aminopeptidase/acylaminoacyl peptidase